MPTPTPTPTPTPPTRAQVTRPEWVAASLVAVVLTGLAVAEPGLLGAPVENARTLAFTIGTALVLVVAFIVMLRLRVPPPIRLLVIAVPLLVVSWWLISPFFRDDVVDEAFETSIAAAEGTATPEAPVAAEAPAVPDAPGVDPPTTADVRPTAPTTTVPPGPRLLGSGAFVGLAGHEGSGDAGFFEQPDGGLVLRLERFDIQNGPDLHLYVVPGGSQVSRVDGSVYLGELRGNVGDQTYDLPADAPLTTGDWTVLVWCEAFGVEFVAATVTVTA